MKIIHEHEVLMPIGGLNPYERSEQYPDGLLLNSHAKPYDQKYFFIWNNTNNEPCYKATYIIGAQRINSEELIIEPRMENIDFMNMFSICLMSDLSPELFAKIYSIDMDDDPIKTTMSVSAALTPMLIVHFLMIMKRITSKGLRSDYVDHNENIKKVKGRIDIRKNERKNIIYKRYDRVFCNYSERSINIPENRLFKKTLLMCKRYVSRMSSHELYSELLNRINVCLSMFEGVEENVELQEIRSTKRNTLFKDYSGAVSLALKIIKKLDNSVADEETGIRQTPVFWIDMSLLYEHYVYGLLHDAYGSSIKYQQVGLFGWKPDFLHTGEKLIMDAKYIPKLDGSGISGLTNDIVSQLGGYSRVKTFTKALGVDDDTVVPCVIIYPIICEKSDELCFDRTKRILDQATPYHSLTQFYKIGVPLPQI